ncbi:hypothetical protein P9112_004049 [Eukaryota sp. TZLM1-RC]
MDTSRLPIPDGHHLITEGSASVIASDDVFYNPVQVFNRDISLLAIHTYNTIRLASWKADVAARKLRILEGLSATGMRSIRFAKELPGDQVAEILANDLSPEACRLIEQSCIRNSVESTVKTVCSDANVLMFLSGKSISLSSQPVPFSFSNFAAVERPSPWDSTFFDVIDLDPFGSAAPFIDSAVSAVRPGGLLCVTSTDQAVLVGQYPDKCMIKYNSLPMHTSCCKESSVRSLLSALAFSAAKHDRVVVPLLSLNVDFYVRVFVRVEKRGNPRSMAGQMINVAFCGTCHSVYKQPCIEITPTRQGKKIQTGHILTGGCCSICDGRLRMAGPFWGGEMHNEEFVNCLLGLINESDFGAIFPFVTSVNKIKGILTMIKDELNVKSPFYFNLDRMSSILKVSSPPAVSARSALINAGFKVSQWHGDRRAFKTNAPLEYVWGMLVDHAKTIEDKKPCEKRDVVFSKDLPSEFDFTVKDSAKLSSRATGVSKFPLNPAPFWGPGSLPSKVGKRTCGSDEEEKKIKC